ncbi:NHLP bacteriocin export ABC transporter permease/ATPase subunit [Streptacidiphilus sp. EB129]|uniref:NHLP bacteriocin export ABC transporter permease/ATPase subunit n=1 Tax=Streptacidiphilus sp. EB129 TaxID=3156262 RepID=UPI0035117937
MTTVAPGVSGFSRFFTDAAVPVDLDDDPLLVLNDPDRVTLVDCGAVDLFAVRMTGGGPHGRWNFLCRAEQGTVLLGVPPGPEHSIVGRPVLDTRLSSLSVETLKELSTGATPAAAGGRVRELAPSEHGLAVRQFVRGLDRGVDALAGPLREALPPRDFTPFEPGTETVVEASKAARSVDGVQWVTIVEGTVRVGEGLLSGPLGPGDELCMTERDWLTAESEVRLHSRSSHDLLADGRLWDHLHGYAERMLHSVDRRIERRNEVERLALASRAANDAEAIGSATRGFAAVLGGSPAHGAPVDVAADTPELAAMRLVAARMGFDLRVPPTLGPPGRRTDKLQRIAQAAGVRTRDLRLEKGWWQQDLGPMVGFRRADGRPVALLPKGRRYVMVAHDEEQPTPVTKDTVGRLTDRGVVLYTPLPAGRLTVRDLLRFSQRRNGRDIRTLIATGALVAVLGLLTPILTGRVLGTFVPDAQRQLVAEGGLLIIGAAVVSAVLSVVQNIAVLRIEGRATSTLQSAVWTRLLSLPASFFADYTTGELAGAALGVSTAQEALSAVTTTATLGVLTGLANLVLVYFYSVQLALVATLLVAIGGSVCLVAGVREVRWQRQVYDVERKLSSRVFQLLGGLSKLRVAAAEDRAFAVWSREFVRGRALASSARRVQILVSTFNAGFPLLCSVILFALIGGPAHGGLSVAVFLSFYSAFYLLLSSTLQFTGVAITTMSVIPMFERLSPILEAEPEVTGTKADPGDLAGGISFNHVSFRYTEDGPLILDDVSFEAKPGEFVAVVGSTGCGKSTMLRLLLGFEAPGSGSVLYDGQDLSELEVTSVRRQCGVVLQNGALLAGDIKTNIIGSTNYTLAEAWEAARMAGVAEDIAAMPMGMQTILSEGVSTLSGGQRQRLMIARALVSRPRILFFDEATSALDNPTQKIVAESTRRLNATRVVIAHRLSTVRDADQIIVLDQGRIVQRGSYEELSAQEGLFATLAARQR